MSMNETISKDESMRLCLRFFEDALRTVAKQADSIRDEYENFPGMAWELRQEILSGRPLIDWPGISDHQRRLIGNVVDAADALGDKGARGETWTELLHPSWDAVRGASLLYLSSIDRLPQELSDD